MLLFFNLDTYRGRQTHFFCLLLVVVAVDFVRFMLIFVKQSILNLQLFPHCHPQSFFICISHTPPHLSPFTHFSTLREKNYKNSQLFIGSSQMEADEKAIFLSMIQTVKNFMNKTNDIEWEERWLGVINYFVCIEDEEANFGFENERRKKFKIFFPKQEESTKHFFLIALKQKWVKCLPLRRPNKIVFEKR